MQRMKVIVVGTGTRVTHLMHELDRDKVDVLFFVDPTHRHVGQQFCGRKVFALDHIVAASFDYVLFDGDSVEVLDKLLQMGVPFQKLVPINPELFHRSLSARHHESLELLKKPRKAPGRKARIALINYNNSNYHGYALMKYIPDDILEKYEVDLIQEENREALHDYDVIVSSHYDGIYHGKHVNIELWHGFPIKRMGLLHEQSVYPSALEFMERRSKHTDLILSYSQLYTTFFNASFPSVATKYRITGMPRNDLLFEDGSLDKLERISNRDLKNEHVVFYMPTWRKGANDKAEVSRPRTGLFGFPDEDNGKILRFVEQNRVFLVVKLHPFEHEQLKDLELFRHERIFLLSDEQLMASNIHLYELLPSAKVLVTDYSSVYFDTLLIDLPVIFAPTDVDEYRESRGFMLEPYQFLTPGPTVFRFQDLEQAFRRFAGDHDEYKEARATVRKLVFRYEDNQSSLRAWREIDNYLTGKGIGRG